MPINLSDKFNGLRKRRRGLAHKNLSGGSYAPLDFGVPDDLPTAGSPGEEADESQIPNSSTQLRVTSAPVSNQPQHSYGSHYSDNEVWVWGALDAERMLPIAKVWGKANAEQLNGVHILCHAHDVHLRLISHQFKEDCIRLLSYIGNGKIRVAAARLRLSEARIADEKEKIMHPSWPGDANGHIAAARSELATAVDNTNAGIVELEGLCGQAGDHLNMSRNDVLRQSHIYCRAVFSCLPEATAAEIFSAGIPNPTEIRDSEILAFISGIFGIQMPTREHIGLEVTS